MAPPEGSGPVAADDLLVVERKSCVKKPQVKTIHSTNSSGSKVTFQEERKSTDLRDDKGSSRPQLPEEELSFRDLNRTSSASSYLSRSWYTLIAVVAILDFLGKVVGDYYKQENLTHDELVADENPLLFRFKKEKQKLAILDSDQPMIVDFIQFLDKYSIVIGIAFSLLWFANTFFVARKKRNELLRQLDRKRLLQNTKPKEEEKLLRKANWVYFIAVVLQCALLPLSFYLIIHHLLTDQRSATDILLDEDETISFNFTTPDGKHDEVYSFSAPLGSSGLFVLCQYAGTLFVRLTGLALRARIKAIVVKISKRAAAFAIRRPRYFTRKVREFLRILRWVKYLIPLIATSNKLRGNMIDLFKKYSQRREAAKAEKARKLLWKKQLQTLPREKILEEAAIKVQRNFRRRQARKAVIAMQVLQGTAENLAAMRVQHVFRIRLARARRRIRQKKFELMELERKNNTKKEGLKKNLKLAPSHKQDIILSDEERRRMYELEDELMTEADTLLNRKMLLRPNTKFAVIWKILFVVCVIFEISQLAFKPILKNYVEEKTGEQMDIGKVLELNLVPTPVTEWKQCGGLLNTERVEKRSPFRWIKQIRRHAQREKHILEDESEENEKPWYCHEIINASQVVYIDILKFLIHEFLIIVGIVCFLDVFVTFFTGELDPANGNLIPKPFLPRWILPGIILQLMVNPQMESVSKHVW
eukprot:CAMPEP_0194255786 /NCGR_PEP_ID=MMETSP0158-20130606/35311_1 /TAXON_ID=33649 /ORGANISM="Thalassionema nitzschioides, Strain L26-B" /LENGTH=702 /DNA_ID=CAMNT_0038994259 /DNA_START=15 /DNA_END=2120 /DNA_ORIENTATION=-